MKEKIISKPDLLKAKTRKSGVPDIIYLESDASSFLLEYAKGRKYFIRTYGCQANIRDEESMRGMLEGVGFSKVESEEEADIIILNTCAVRENAEDKVYGEIGNLKRLRQIKKDLIIVLCGCIPEEPDILERILNTYP